MFPQKTYAAVIKMRNEGPELTSDKVKAKFLNAIDSVNERLHVKTLRRRAQKELLLKQRRMRTSTKYWRA